MTTLKRCPFCKSTKIHPAGSSGFPVPVNARCLNCGVRGPERFCGKYADDSWNTRPIEDELRARIAELESFVRDVRDDWDCDTGANEAHHSHCRACEAKRLLPKEDTK